MRADWPVFFALSFAFCAPLTMAGSSIFGWGIVVLAFLYTRAWTHERPSWAAWGWAFVLFSAAGILSALLSDDVARGLRVWRRKDLYVLLVPALLWALRDADIHRRFARLFMLGGLLSAAWGVITWTIGVNQFDCHKGAFLHVPPALADWPENVLSAMSLMQGRAIGGRCHPLTFSCSLLFVWAMLLARGIWNPKPESLWKTVLPGWLVLLAIVFSQSRGPVLVAVAMLAIAMIARRSSRAFTVAGLSILPVVLALMQPQLAQRARTLGDGSFHSNAERVHMWKVGRTLWREHPVLGLGPGMVKVASRPYLSEEELVNGGWPHLHNVFLNVAVERGAVGLLLFLSVLALLAREFWRRLKEASAQTDVTPWAPAAGLLSLAAFAGSGLTQTVYNDEAVLFTFYAAIAWALAAPRTGRSLQ